MVKRKSINIDLKGYELYGISHDLYYRLTHSISVKEVASLGSIFSFRQTSFNLIAPISGNYWISLPQGNHVVLSMNHWISRVC